MNRTRVIKHDMSIQRVYEFLRGEDAGDFILPGFFGLGPSGDGVPMNPLHELIARDLYYFDIDLSKVYPSGKVIAMPEDKVIRERGGLGTYLLHMYPRDTIQHIHICSRLLDDQHDMPLEQLFAGIEPEYVMRSHWRLYLVLQTTFLLVGAAEVASVVELLEVHLKNDTFLAGLCFLKGWNLDAKVQQIIAMLLLKAAAELRYHRYRDDLLIDKIITWVDTFIATPAATAEMDNGEYLAEINRFQALRRYSEDGSLTQATTYEEIMQEEVTRDKVWEALWVATMAGDSETALHLLRDNLDLYVHRLRESAYTRRALAGTLCMMAEAWVSGGSVRGDRRHQLLKLLVEKYLRVWYFDPVGPAVFRCCLSDGDLECVVCASTLAPGEAVVRCAHCREGVLCTVCYRRLREREYELDEEVSCPTCRAEVEDGCNMPVLCLQRAYGVDFINLLDPEQNGWE